VRPRRSMSVFHLCPVTFESS